MAVGSGGIRSPHIGAIADGHADRLDALERAVASTKPSQRPASDPFEMPFSFPSSLVAARSPRYYLRTSRRLTSVFFSLDTAGSTATTFKIYRSGTALTPSGVGAGMTVSGTVITLTASTATGAAFFDHVFSKDADYLQVEIISIGTGAKDLDAQARFG